MKLKDCLHYYIGTGVQVLSSTDNKRGVLDMIGSTTVAFKDSEGFRQYRIEEVKLLLNPLSALTKPIVVEGYNEGKEFIPIDHLYQLSDYVDFIESIENDKYELMTPARWPFELFQLLLRWHFNVFNLIDSGQAIDKTTLK